MGLLLLLPRGIEFDRLCHQVVAHDVKRFHKFTADPRQALAAVDGFNKKFLGRFHDRLSEINGLVFDMAAAFLYARS